MAVGTQISWTEATWNPIVGCSVLSPGCKHCYAMRMARRLELMGQARYAGLTQMTAAGPVWTGETRPVFETLFAPVLRAKPTIYFVNSMSDLFHETVPQEIIDRIFAVMAISARHVFQLLTKRSARMRAYLRDPETPGRIYQEVCSIVTEEGHDFGVILIAHPGQEAFAPPGPRVRLGVWPLPNVWLGISAEDQKRADERIPDLLQSPAALRWVSAEPLLGRIDFRMIAADDTGEIDALTGTVFCQGRNEPAKIPRLDWIVVGGESGPEARPMHPDWARQIRDACRATDVIFHFKQWGAWIPKIDRERDDPDWRADYSHKFNDRRPEIRWLNLDGGRGFHGERFHIMRRVGAKKAGYELDGQTHRDLPKLAA